MNIEVIAKTVQFAAKTALLACCSTALARQLPACATPIPNGLELVSGPSRIDVQILEDRVVGVHVQLDSGNYASPLRTYLLRIHAVARHVSIDGRPLPRGAGQTLTDSSTANLANVGWTLASDRFGPAILLRVSAGKKTATIVELR